MTILLFLVVLSVLIIAHELGHFLTAKAVGMRVDEFGLGYPPRAKKLFRWNNTDFTLNWLPFGGFVKIFGEDPDEASEKSFQSFTSKSRELQAMVLLAGISANILLAWALFSVAFMIGVPASESSNLPISNPQSMIAEVMPNSPAALGDVRTGDVLVGLDRDGQKGDVEPGAATEFITSSGDPVTLTLLRGKTSITRTLAPREGIVPNHPAIGVAIDTVGTAKLSVGRAIREGARTTWGLTFQTAKGLGTFLKNIFTGQADLSQVSGPVGLIGLVGDAKALGFVYLLTFTALISINLAVLNLLPIPALDGGRLLFVIIEVIRRKPIPAKVFNFTNNLGFGLLLLLMVIITVHDLVHLL